MRYAYKRRKTDTPRLAADDNEPIYHEATWWGSMPLFSKRWEYTHRKAGIEIGDTMTAYDVRVVSAEDEQHIREFDEEIRELQRQKHEFIRERFLVWEPITKASCVKVVAGRSKSEAMALVRS
jgi:hypothetical protein